MRKLFDIFGAVALTAIAIPFLYVSAIAIFALVFSCLAQFCNWYLALPFPN